MSKSSLYIALSLGHNASAVGIADGEIVAAYEQERFTREKSSSKFAVDAINKIIDIYQPDPETENYFLISHWYDNFNFMNDYHEKINKHFNYDLIEDYKKNYNFKIIALDKQFTHHDAHAEAVLSFFHNHCTTEQFEILANNENGSYIFVFDGFGNKQEVASIYRIIKNEYGLIEYDLLDRLYGYDNSLGLMYQYATSFTGMKENEDEYKFLGYESRILDVIDNRSQKYIHREAAKFAENWVENFKLKSNIEVDNSDPYYINLNKLNETKTNWHIKFQNLIDTLVTKYNLKPIDSSNKEDVSRMRSIIGHYIQTVIEYVHQMLIDYYKADNVLVCGGLYYNVKLNNTILKHIPGLFCAAPLAGDQGAAIGVYVKCVGDFPYYDLTWGNRDYPVELNIPEEVKPHVEIVSSQNELVNKAVKYLRDNHIVQVFAGDMEFGPRALCNSSTLSIGYHENVDLINSINGRNTVMPFAPVTIPSAAKEVFNNKQLEKVVGSLGYMIVTVDYKEKVMNLPETFNLYRGVANPYPLKSTYSGRPQIVQDTDSHIYKIVDKLYQELGIAAIINTSLNVHGKPIVFTPQDAIDDLVFNLNKANELGIDKSKIHLLILNNKN